jgi:HK97 family phage portal protein
MNLLRAIVKAADPRAWISASTRSFEMRTGEGRAAPFDHKAAVAYYNSWIYAAASINANAVASTPLRLYVRGDNATRQLWNTRAASRKSVARLRGDTAHQPSAVVMRKAAELGDDFEEVTDDHPLLRLLSTANPWFNGYDATVLRVVWQELTGNAYLHVITDAFGTPTELWPMPPQWTEVIPDPVEFISGYRYGKGSESKQNFPADEVIHFRRPNPRDLFYGMGKLEAAWGAANANAALHSMDLAMFQNNGRPDYLLTIKGNASGDELERVERAIKQKFRGPRNRGNFMVSTAEIDVKPLAFPPKDLTGRDDVVEEIAAVFGVPVSMLKANDPNLAGASIGFASWREMTVLPLCRMDEETLNQRLLPMFGLEGDAVLAYDDPVPLNRQQDLTETQVAVSGGWLTPNEARERYGLERTDDPMADRLLVNGQPLGAAAPAPMALDATPPQTAAITPPAPPVATSADAVAPSAAPTTATKSALSDCVAAKIPTLLAEGYDESQAAAIAYEMCGESKALQDIDTVPPQAVADNARRALEVRESKPPSQRGMTATGIARARDLANRVAVSEDTVRRMVAYFERHESDKQGATWDEQGKGWQAWHGWGGDEGWTWAKRKRDEFDRERGEKSRAKSCACCGTDAHAVKHSDLWLTDADRITKAAGTGELVDDELLAGFLKGVDAVFAAQVRAVVAAIKREGDATPETVARAVGVLERGAWHRELVDALAPYIRRSLQHGADIGFANLSKLATSTAVAELGWSSKELAEYVERGSVRLASRAADSINGYTVERLRDMFGEGMSLGENTDELAERVQEWARGEGDDVRATRRRATMIARTEAARAAATAETDAWKSTGLVSGKRWILAPDPCEFCEAVAKRFTEKGVGLEDSFYAKGDTLTGADGGKMKLDYEEISAPPLHPNCRCAMQPTLVDDYENIAAEAERRARARKV